MILTFYPNFMFLLSVTDDKFVYRITIEHLPIIDGNQISLGTLPCFALFRIPNLLTTVQVQPVLSDKILIDFKI